MSGVGTPTPVSGHQETGVGVPTPDTTHCVASKAREMKVDTVAQAGNTIFVQIAAYRDSECVPTIADLFQKAARPGNISVGVCWQFLPGIDTENLPIDSFAKQVRVLGVAANKSRGVCSARHQAEQFFNGEDYVLQIDSHTRFVPNWDELMREELARCSGPRAALTCNPPRYYPPGQVEPNPRPMVKRAAPFMPGGDIRCQAEYLDFYPESPVQSAFISGAFVFARSDLIRKIPYDPWLYFNQEEITYAMRLFTHGWNIYCPSRVLIYHHYYDAAAPTRPHHWQDCKEWGDYQKIGIARFNHLSKFAVSADPNVLVDLEKYTLGTARSLEEFQEFCGVDFRTKTVTERGSAVRFVRGSNAYEKPRYEFQCKFRPKTGNTCKRLHTRASTNSRMHPGNSKLAISFRSLPFPRVTTRSGRFSITAVSQRLCFSS